jgi:ferritin-like metal-binding protein YciE
MSKPHKKIVQYLNEAHASEVSLISVLQSQLAMTPAGSYRDAVESHLADTRGHARRIQERLEQLGQSRNLLQASIEKPVVGFTETLFGQMLALSMTPFDLLRGSSAEEKVLKNAKDAYTTEALEIATYAAIERLAHTVGDEQTAALAASIRGDEERMLERIMGEIPHLTDAAVAAEIGAQPSPEMSAAAAADTAGKTVRQGTSTTRKTAARTVRPAQRLRKVPADTQIEDQREDVVASEALLPIEGYRARSIKQIVTELAQLSQLDLDKIESHERQNDNRSAILLRISALRGEEPWPGYDDLTVAEIDAVLNEGDYERARAILDYERLHKNRPSVVQSALVPARFLVTADS